MMETMIRSEALRLPIGPRLEEVRFPGQGAGTDRERCPVGAHGRPWGRDRADSGSSGCVRRAEASPPCSAEL
jgi:hypothetical protein